MTLYARQAIVTTYHGPTNTKGPRVSATAGAGRVIIGWDNALDIVENHTAAARAFAQKFGWDGEFTVGALPSGGYVFAHVLDNETTVTL